MVTPRDGKMRMTTIEFTKNSISIRIFSERLLLSLRKARTNLDWKKFKPLIWWWIMSKTPEAAKEDILNRLKRELPYLQQKYGVARIALYGSFARSEQTTKSDVDLLVELTRPLGFEFVDLANYLEEVLGRKVDLATFNAFEYGKGDPRRRHIAFNVEKDLVYVQ